MNLRLPTQGPVPGAWEAPGTPVEGGRQEWGRATTMAVGGPLAASGELDSPDLGVGRVLLTETEAFRRWFGTSKVRDEDGQPLVVYHGTTSVFTEFVCEKSYPYFSAMAHEANLYATFSDKLKAAIGLRRKYLFQPADEFDFKPVYSGDENPGYLDDYEGPLGVVFPIDDALAVERKNGFTILTGKCLEFDPKTWTYTVVDGTSSLESDYRQTIAKYEEEAMLESPSVIPVYLSIQNPYVTDDATYAAQFVHMNPEPGNVRLVDHHKEVARLRELGYDGIVAPSDGARFARIFGGGPEHDVLNYIVFDACQVKSAIGNSGGFDPTNPDIRA